MRNTNKPKINWTVLLVLTKYLMKTATKKINLENKLFVKLLSKINQNKKMDKHLLIILFCLCKYKRY